MLRAIFISTKVNTLLKWNPVEIWNGPATVRADA